MKTIVVSEKKMTQWTSEERKKIYGCEIIFERASLVQIKDPSLPNDAYLVFYRVNNETYMDLCRGKKVKIFDMYYDKYGPGSVQKINFGYGRLNPKLWGYKPAKEKKK